MRISIWWLIPAFYTGVFFGIFIIAFCRAAKNNDQPLTNAKTKELKHV